MTSLRVFTVLAAALLLLSCSSSPKNEQVEERQGKDSRDRDSLFSPGTEIFSRPALEIPPDLLASSNERVQTNTDTAARESRVLPEVIGATIQSGEGRSWLEIDADAEVVWRKLTEFWAFQEIELVQYQPETGLMETDWFVKSDKKPGQGITSVAVELFEAFTNRRTALDKFTVRLERSGSGGTNLYVTHRGREKIANEPANKSKEIIFEWVERESDSEKIAQLLQALVLLFDSGNQESA